MPDAIEAARAALTRIDARAVAADLDGIEEQIAALDSERLAHREIWREAAAREAANSTRFAPNNPASSRQHAALKAAVADAVAKAQEFRESDRELRQRHRDLRVRLTRDVDQAFRHIARIAAGEAEAVAQYAEAVKAFAGILAKPRAAVDVPAAPAVDLPAKSAIAELLAIARPALAVADRTAPAERSATDFAPRSPSATFSARRVA